MRLSPRPRRFTPSLRPSPPLHPSPPLSLSPPLPLIRSLPRPLSQSLPRSLPLVLASAISLVLVSGPAAMAQSRSDATPPAAEPRALDLPPQPLGQALNELARQANLQMTFPAALVAGKTAPAVSGPLTVRQALDRLLEQSGLQAVIDGRTVVIRPAPATSSGTRTLTEVRVTAAAINEAPLGYLAARRETGALGDRSVLDTPFSVTVVNSDEIVERGARSINQIFANDAAVYTGTASYSTDWWGTQIRGLPVRNYFIDGVPMMLYWGGDFPVEIAENVTALKGLTGFMHGFGTPGGALSYDLKRVKDIDETTVYLGWRNPGLVSLHVDTSRKLTEDFGLRANVATERGTTYNDSKIERTVASLAFDKRFRGSVSWFTTLAYESHRNKGEPFFFSDLEEYETTQNGAGLPSPTYRYQDIDVDNSYYKTRTLLAVTGLKWQIDERWSLKTQVGVSRRTHWSNKSFASLTNRAGDYKGWTYNFAGKLDSLFTQAIVQGTLNTGPVRHDIVAGVGLQRSRDRYSNEFYYENDFDGNLYQNQPFQISRTPDFSYAPATTDTQRYAFISDTVHLGEHWQVVAGLRYNDFRAHDSGNPSAPDYETSKASPTLALIYKPDARTSFYASYVQALEPGTRVSPPYANAGQLLGATISKQYEIGAKHESGRVGYAAALFRVQLANQMDRKIGEERYFTQDGLNIYQGAEVSTAWQVDRALKVGLSAVYLDATLDRVSIDSAALEGKTPANAPKWQAALSAQYRVPALDRLKLHGNVQYFGAAWATPQNRLEVPGRSIVNAGFSYDFTLQGHDLTLIGNVYNLFDKKYWALSDWSRMNVGEGRNVSLAVLGRF